MLNQLKRHTITRIFPNWLQKQSKQNFATTTTACNSNSNLRKMLNYLPFFASGEIVRGFGRGSKELGIPTANYSLDVVKSLPEALRTGIYYGWANVNNGEVYKMVLSIGWNPYYVNKEKSMETHIIHEFGKDLYGDILKVCIVGYLRPEKNFDSLESLITAIKNDIAKAKELLDPPHVNLELKESKFFTEIIDNSAKYNAQYRNVIYKNGSLNGSCND